MEQLLICIIFLVIIIFFIKAPRLGEEEGHESHESDTFVAREGTACRENYEADGFLNPFIYPVVLTDHAKERMRERLRIHDGALMQKYACDAYKYGKSARQLSASVRYRINQMQEEKGGVVLLYKGYVYIFSEENVLITVYKNENIYV